MKSSLRPLDVPEVHVEDLAALAEPADHVEDLTGWVVEHLGDGALAEIEAVIGALVHLHEPLQPLDGAEHPGHSAVAWRRVRVVRMTGETHLRGSGYRDDCGEETIDTLPVLLFRDDAGPGRRGAVVGAAPAEGGVARTAAPWFPLGARDADDAEIVFGCGNAGGGETLDQRADAVDLALPLGILAHQDVRALLLFDRPRRQRQLHHVEREAEDSTCSRWRFRSSRLQ